MKKLIVTQKGAELKCNKWKEGQEISCNESLAADFIKRGLCTDPESKEDSKTSKTSKTSKK